MHVSKPVLFVCGSPYRDEADLRTLSHRLLSSLERGGLSLQDEQTVILSSPASAEERAVIQEAQAQGRQIVALNRRARETLTEAGIPCHSLPQDVTQLRRCEDTSFIETVTGHVLTLFAGLLSETERQQWNPHWNGSFRISPEATPHGMDTEADAPAELLEPPDHPLLRQLDARHARRHMNMPKNSRNGTLERTPPSHPSHPVSPKHFVLHIPAEEAAQDYLPDEAWDWEHTLSEDHQALESLERIGGQAAHVQALMAQPSLSGAFLGEDAALFAWRQALKTRLLHAGQTLPDIFMPEPVLYDRDFIVYINPPVREHGPAHVHVFARDLSEGVKGVRFALVEDGDAPSYAVPFPYYKMKQWIGALAEGERLTLDTPKLTKKYNMPEWQIQQALSLVNRHIDSLIQSWHAIYYGGPKHDLYEDTVKADPTGRVSEVNALGVVTETPRRDGSILSGKS